MGRGLTRREFLAASAGLLGLGLGGWYLLGTNKEDETAILDLEVFRQGYPRAFFFRTPEGAAASGKLSYREWEKRFLPLNGIMGKVLNEMHDHTGKNNLEFFLRYKKENPNKLVLLHYSGTGRRVADGAITDFFAGHWLYYKATTLTQKVGPS